MKAKLEKPGAIARFSIHDNGHWLLLPIALALQMKQAFPKGPEAYDEPP